MRHDVIGPAPQPYLNQLYLESSTGVDVPASAGKADRSDLPPNSHPVPPCLAKHKVRLAEQNHASLVLHVGTVSSRPTKPHSEKAVAYHSRRRQLHHSNMTGRLPDVRLAGVVRFAAKEA